MSKVRIVYRMDGGVAIIHPAPNSHREDETEKEWLERVFTKAMRDGLYGCDYDDVDKSEIPTDRTYRDAWKGNKIDGIYIDQVLKADIDAKKDRLSNIERLEVLETKVAELELVN